MVATAAVRKTDTSVFFPKVNIYLIQAGQEFLKRSWGEDQLNKVNAVLNARDEQDSTPSTSKAKPKLSKARTMQNTTQV